MEEKHSKSQEDYLETILLLKRKQGTVRSVDIANALSFSKPSISRAVSLMRDGGYITMDPVDHTIELTEQGESRARQVYRKHCILHSLLLAAGITGREAEQCACEIEHILTDDMCDRLAVFLADNGYDLVEEYEPSTV